MTRGVTKRFTSRKMAPAISPAQKAARQSTNWRSRGDEVVISTTPLEATEEIKRLRD
jgi:hypothetical protein